jgi:ribosome maturation factor RimP
MLSVEMDKPAVGVETIRDAVEAAAASLGCELWDITLAGPVGNRILRVYIDAAGGVDLDRCARLSRSLRPLLDDPEIGLEDVDLEVSSPGAERSLRGMSDYLRFIGQRVNLRFRHGDAETVVEGPLLRVTDEALTVATAREQSTEVPISDLVSARLAVEFGGDDRPNLERRAG